MPPQSWNLLCSIIEFFWTPRWKNIWKHYRIPQFLAGIYNRVSLQHVVCRKNPITTGLSCLFLVWQNGHDFVRAYIFSHKLYFVLRNIANKHLQGKTRPFVVDQLNSARVGPGARNLVGRERTWRLYTHKEATNDRSGGGGKMTGLKGGEGRSVTRCPQ